MNDAQTKIAGLINQLPQWQQKNLIAFRALVHGVEPEVAEDWKWNVPVFLLDGKLVCAMSGFSDHTKFNFFHGASLADPDKYLNAGLESKKMRALALLEGEEINESKLRAVIQEAFAISRA